PIYSSPPPPERTLPDDFRDGDAGLVPPSPPPATATFADVPANDLQRRKLLPGPDGYPTEDREVHGPGARPVPARRRPVAAAGLPARLLSRRFLLGRRGLGGRPLGGELLLRRVELGLEIAQQRGELPEETHELGFVPFIPKLAEGGRRADRNRARRIAAL